MSLSVTPHHWACSGACGACFNYDAELSVRRRRLYDLDMAPVAERASQKLDIGLDAEAAKHPVNVRARAAGKIYDGLSVLFTCACCGTEDGKVQLVSAAKVRSWYNLDAIKRSWHDYKLALVDAYGHNDDSPGLDDNFDDRLPPCFVAKTVKAPNGNTHLAGMDNASGLLRDDEGRPFASPYYNGGLCRSCCSFLTYNKKGEERERKANRKPKPRRARKAPRLGEVSVADDDDDDEECWSENDSDVAISLDGDDEGDDDCDDDEDAPDCADETAPKKKHKKRSGLPHKTLANFLWPGMVPDVLLGLTRVEKSMMAIYNCVTSYGLADVRSGSTYALKKKTSFAVVQDLAEIVKVIPRSSKLTDNCMLGGTGEKQYSFRPYSVLESLDFFVKWNLHYIKWLRKTESRYARDDFVREHGEDPDVVDPCDHLRVSLDEDENEALGRAANIDVDPISSNPMGAGSHEDVLLMGDGSDFDEERTIIMKLSQLAHNGPKGEHQ